VRAAVLGFPHTCIQRDDAGASFSEAHKQVENLSFQSDNSVPPTQDGRSNPAAEAGIDRQSMEKWFEMYYPGVPVEQAAARLPDIPPGSWGTCAAVGGWCPKHHLTHLAVSPGHLTLAVCSSSSHSQTQGQASL
jgi:hypothetical protein